MYDHSLARRIFQLTALQPDRLRLRFPSRPRRSCVDCRLKPSREKQDDEDDQDDADKANAAMTIAVAVAAEAATESTEPEDDEDNDEDKTERHSAVLSS